MMNDETMVSKMSEILHKAAGLLAKWLEPRLRNVSEEWWVDCVLLKLSEMQRKVTEEKGYRSLSELDLAALLRVADKNWYSMSIREYLTVNERNCLKNMQSVRNNWAHMGSALPEASLVLGDLEIVERFYELMYADRKDIEEIQSLIDGIKRNGEFFVCEKTEGRKPREETTIRNSGSEIQEMDIVTLVSDPRETGLVTEVTEIGNTKQFKVFIAGKPKVFYEGQIRRLEDDGNEQSSVEELRHRLTAYEIDNPSSSNLYSLNSARIDFVPYQFRPVIKMTRADLPRILIADSVGVGKTIEAGLIIKELEARDSINSVIVICPKPLVTERKWELEMKRFDEDFAPMDGESLRRAISDCDRDGEWPDRWIKAIIPYSILDGRTYEGTKGKKRRSIGLFDLSPVPHFDLVIVDEAHHIRNGSMEKEKAFAYKCTKWFCDHADAVVMLTATPLQNGNDDLFTLMNVLRPDIILDKDSFAMMTAANPHITKAGQIVRTGQGAWRQEALKELKAAEATQWGKVALSDNPRYIKAMQLLKDDKLDRAGRVKLISVIETLHSLDAMLNRTRRRDIQDFCIRRSETIVVPFTEPQKQLHNKLLEFEAASLARLHGMRSVSFMMSTIRRQASSCLYGLAPFIEDLINKRLESLDEFYLDDLDETGLSISDIEELEHLAEEVHVLAQNLPESDPKIEKVIAAVQAKQGFENNKVIIFSSFRHTLEYVARKINEAQIRTGIVNGSVKDEDRESLRNRFALPKDSPEAIDVMLFTEVGSEGLDYQFCDMMINYDLPWNPMRIEQRIGRIDRRGQKSEVVTIYNVLTAGTVDADIYERCLLRIGVFENSIGECEEILGSVEAEIRAIAYNGKLTDEERREKLEQISDNKQREIQELAQLEEQEQGLFGFDLSGILSAETLQEAESPWLLPEGIRSLVVAYLSEIVGGDLPQSRSGLLKLSLSKGVKEKLKNDYSLVSCPKSDARRTWERMLDRNESSDVELSFERSIADENRKSIFVNVMHPLAKQAAKWCISTPSPCVAVRVCSDGIDAGEYPFRIYSWKKVGSKYQTELVPICVDPDLENELFELIQCGTTVSVRQTSEAQRQFLDRRHFELWSSAKDRFKDDVGREVKYKEEIARNRFETRQAFLKNQIGSACDDRIQRMRTAELSRLEQENVESTKKLQEVVEHADLLAEQLVEGVLVVE